MKLKFISILLFIVIFSSLVLAQNTNEVKLTDVSDNVISYYCFGCNPQVDGREGSLVWYKCEKDTWNCQISVRRTSDDHELAIVKFNKARAYFENKKLMYITVDPSYTHPSAVPFNIAGIEIPFVSAGDRINFGRANTVNGGPALRPTNLAYFQTFYYEIGTGARTIAIDEKETPLHKTVKRGEKLPLSLCGQEFFDVTSELIRGRDRNSWFLVKKRGPDCIVSSYRISTNPDDLWLRNNNNLAVRVYPCGTNKVYFATKHSSGELANAESESRLTNFECKVDSNVTILNCPESNEDEKTLCESETKNILFQAGSTQYFVTGGKITVYLAVMPPDIDSTSIVLSDAQSIKVFNGRNGVGILPEGDAEIFFAGHLDNPDFSAESQLLVKKGRVITTINNQVVDYVLNRPEDTPESFTYALNFVDNSIYNIADPNFIDSEPRLIGGVNIKGLRFVQDISTLGLGMKYNLFPLKEGDVDIRVSEAFVEYIVRREGITLRDIAKIQPGINQNNAVQVIDIMESIRQTSGTYYEDSLTNPEFRGPQGWATPNQFGTNTLFRPGDYVLIPAGRVFEGTAGNRVTTTATPERARQNVQERAQRRVSRPVDDSQCLRLSGECQNNAVAGESCLILRENKAGYYNRGSCLSKPSSSYLCCVPESSSTMVGGQTRRIQSNAPQERIQDRDSFCVLSGGYCLQTSDLGFKRKTQSYRNNYCKESKDRGSFGRFDDNSNWVDMNIDDCNDDANSVGICCGRANNGENNVPVVGIQSARVTKVEIKNGANWVALTSSTANGDLITAREDSYDSGNNRDSSDISPLDLKERLILKRSPRTLLCHIAYTIEGSSEQRALLTNDNLISKTYNINDRTNQQEMNRAYNLYRRELTSICSNVAADVVTEHLLSLSPGSGIPGRNYQLSVVRP